MKKVPLKETYELKSSKLYLDDIKEIYEILFKKTNIISFIVGRADIEKFEDFDDPDLIKSGSADYLNIKTSGPTIDIILDKKHAEITLSDSEDTDQLGIKSKLERILAQRIPFLAKVPGDTNSWGIAYICSTIGLVVFGNAWISSVADGQLNIGYLTGSIISLASFIFSIAKFRALTTRYSIIKFSDSSIEESFYQRNKDGPLMRWLEIGISIIVTAFVTWFLGRA